MGFQFREKLARDVVDGKKTQTRRPIKEGDHFIQGPDIWSNQEVHRNRLLWHRGGIYAVQPGRGKPGIGHLQITNIKTEDVRCISLEDAIEEGFNNRIEFLQVWTSFYDPQVEIKKSRDGWDICYRLGKAIAYEWHDRSEEDVIEGLMTRPDNLYQAYAISFKLWAR